MDCKIRKYTQFIIYGFFAIIILGCTHKVLIVGGVDNNGRFLNSADIYNPISKTFSKSKSLMSVPRMSPTATRLADGSILITGGQTPAATLTADLYHANSDTFVPTSPMLNTHVAPTATFLSPTVVQGPLSSHVLIAGDNTSSTNENSAELYQPLAQNFRRTSNMTTSRRQHTAILISHCNCAADGKVLLVGGYDKQSKVLASAELYDPLTETFKQTGSMQSPRFRHTATLLNDGTVLISGGASQLGAKPNNINPALNTAELYDPKTGRFTTLRAKMNAHRVAHGATLLRDNTVLLTGGQDEHFIIENTAEIYNPTNKTFTALSATCSGSPPPSGCMRIGRDFHITQRLDDGTVLIAGGVDSAFQTVATAEIYTPATKTFSTTGSMTEARNGAAASLILP